jgi:hypothetical protein
MIGFGWIAQQIVCVLESGFIVIFDIHGDSAQKSLGENIVDIGIISCLFYESGVVILSSKFEFFDICNVADPNPLKLAKLDLSAPPKSWALISPEQSQSKHVEIIVSKDETVFMVDSVQAQDQFLTQGPFLKISISPNGKYIAFFTQLGALLIIKSDFQQICSEFKTSSSQAPIEMNWFGNDGVLLHWEDMILLVDISGNGMKLKYNGVVTLVTELDCARIISQDKHEIIALVQHANERIFQIGSTHPGAILFHARELFEVLYLTQAKNPRSEEHLRSVKPMLANAVDFCIEAAGNEFNVHSQKDLLKSASFGKVFLVNYPANAFVDMAKHIRVLNCVRTPEIGMPLTYSQFLKMGPEKLIEILTGRRHYNLAKHICEYLKIPVDNVLIEWACLQVA